MQPSINPARCGPTECGPTRWAELAQLRQKIRWGVEPDNPALIRRWLELENCEAGDTSLAWQRQCHEHQFALLLETVVDELVIAHWRCLCLDNIYRPLQALKKISDGVSSDMRIQHLVRELAIQTRYVRHSLRF